MTGRDVLDAEVYQIGDRVAHADPDYEDEFTGTVIGVSDGWLSVQWDTWHGNQDQVRPADAQPPAAVSLTKAVEHLRDALWALWEEDDSAVNQSAVGLIDWASLWLGYRLTNDQKLKMADQLAMMAGGLRGEDDSDEVD